MKTRLSDIVSHLRNNCCQIVTQQLQKSFSTMSVIQLCDSSKIHYLTREFHVKLHLKTLLRDSCDIGFRVQFNAEFPRPVMNFPIVYATERLSLCYILHC